MSSNNRTQSAADVEALQLAARARMQRWLDTPELRHVWEAAATPSATGLPGEPEPRVGPFIAISRETGAGGGHIARLVGQQLGWDVLDKELLDFMARQYQLPRDMLEFMDETKAHVVHDFFRCLFAKKSVSQEDYLTHLVLAIYLAGIHGRVVIVGRGAHCILPRAGGLAVRIIAPRDWRVEQFMQRRMLSRAEAENLIAESDAGRSELCQYYLGHDAQDPLLFDIVLNVARITAETAADEIVRIAQRVIDLPAPNSQEL